MRNAAWVGLWALVAMSCGSSSGGPWDRVYDHGSFAYLGFCAGTALPQELRTIQHGDTLTLVWNDLPGAPALCIEPTITGENTATFAAGSCAGDGLGLGNAAATSYAWSAGTIEPQLFTDGTTGISLSITGHYVGTGDSCESDFTVRFTGQRQ